MQSTFFSVKKAPFISDWKIGKKKKRKEFIKRERKRAALLVSCDS